MATQFENLLSSSEVADILGISSNEVAKLCNSGKLPHLRVGVGSKKRYRIRPSALQGYIAGCEHKPSTPIERPKRKPSSNEAGALLGLREFGYQR